MGTMVLTFLPFLYFLKPFNISNPQFFQIKGKQVFLKAAFPSYLTLYIKLNHVYEYALKNKKCYTNMVSDFLV